MKSTHARLLHLAETNVAICLTLGAAAVFLMLLAAVLGLYPVVFADEYVYSKIARLVPFADAPVPGYFYLLIYRATNVCGSGFLACARVLNAFLFVAAAPFIYIVARRVAGRLPAMVVALLAIAGPVNSYAAYFMPEAAYFLAFWVFAALLLAERISPPALHYAVCGVSFALLALIKPHALFLLPAVLLQITYTGWRARAGWPVSILRNAAVLLLTAGIVKFGLSYLLAGRSGLTFFGPLYSEMAASRPADIQRLLSVAWNTADNLRGHVFAMSLLFGLPLAVSILSFTGKDRVDGSLRTPAPAFALFSLSSLTILILVSALFAASVAGSGPYESIERLHMRYYNFEFPILLIIAAYATTAADQSSPLGRLLIAIPLCAIIAYAVFTHLDGFLPDFVDAPELRGVSAGRRTFWIVGTLSSASIALWAWRPRPGARLFLFVCVPLCTAVAWYFVMKDLRPHMNADAYDRAGTFVRQFLPSQERDKLVVAGDSVAALHRAMFLVDSPNVRLEVTSASKRDGELKLPAGTHWVLSFEDEPSKVDAFSLLRMPGFILARLAVDLTADFTGPPTLGIIASTGGLSNPEPIGTWSTGKLVTLRFAGPLPERFTLQLTGTAFGPNAGRPFTARVGDGVAEFELAQGTETKMLEFHNPSRSDSLAIEVPAPTSPQDIGLSPDQRKLGIAIVRLTVIPR